MGQIQRIDAHRDNVLALVVAVVLMAAVFVLDMFTPLGIAVWVGYLLPIWYLSRFSLTGAILPSATLTCTALIVVGYLLSPPGISPIIAAGDRIMGAALLWIMTIILIRTQTADERVKAAQEHLQESEARYRELIQALPAAVYTCDERGRITLYNQAAAALWGREPEVGKDLWCGSWKIYRPDGTPLPLDECPMAVTLREGRAIRGEEIVIERPDGTRRHVLPHPEPIRNAEGVVVGAINMLIDITDLQQAERAMAHLAAIVMSSEDAIISKNLQGIVTSWNGAAERLFGYTAEEMIGQPVSRLIPPDRHDEEPGILERIKRGESIQHYETIRRRKDGTDLHISLTVSPLIDLHGKIIGASKIARNITEQKRVEEALRERDRALTTVNDALKKQTVALAEANKELEGFSYSVSHDLRAPLRTIDAFSRIVEEDHGPQLNAEGAPLLDHRPQGGRSGRRTDRRSAGVFQTGPAGHEFPFGHDGGLGAGGGGRFEDHAGRPADRSDRLGTCPLARETGGS